MSCSERSSARTRPRADTVPRAMAAEGRRSAADRRRDARRSSSQGPSGGSIPRGTASAAPRLPAPLADCDIVHATNHAGRPARARPAASGRHRPRPGVRAVPRPVPAERGCALYRRGTPRGGRPRRCDPRPVRAHRDRPRGRARADRGPDPRHAARLSSARAADGRSSFPDREELADRGIHAPIHPGRRNDRAAEEPRPAGAAYRRFAAQGSPPLARARGPGRAATS